MKNHIGYCLLLLLKICWPVIFLAIVAGCKPVQVVREQNSLVMPRNFDVGTTIVGSDSSNVGSIQWRKFFRDSNLQSLLDTALAANFDLSIATQRLRQLQAGVLAAEAPLYPTVLANGSASLRRFGLYTMDGAGNASTDILPGKLVPEHLPDFFMAAQASWEIDLWGKLRNLKQAAANRYLAGVEGQNLIKTATVTRIAEAYFNLQSLDAQSQILDDYIALQQNALELVRIQKESGSANELAVKQFENQLLDLRGIRSDIQIRIVENESVINFLSGRFPQAVERSSLFLDQSLPEVISLGVPAEMLQNRPDIRAATLELTAANADLSAAKALFFPALNIGAVLGTQAFRPDFLITRPASLTYNLIGGVIAPLVNKRAIRAEFNRADAYQLEALTSYYQTIVNAYTEAYNQVAISKNLEQQFALKTEQVQVIESAVDISGELFRSGRANYLEVLTAQQNALDTRLELVDLRLRQWLAAVGLYRALGGGWR